MTIKRHNFKTIDDRNCLGYNSVTGKRGNVDNYKQFTPSGN